MQAKYPVKVRAIRSKGMTNQFYVFIPAPDGCSHRPRRREGSSVKLNRQDHTTGQTVWSVGGRDYAIGEEKGEKK